MIPPHKNAKKSAIKKASREVGKVQTVIREAKASVKHGSLGRSFLKGAGNMIAGALGLPPGSSDPAANAISDIIGLGDYRVQHNSIAVAPDSVPKFNSSSDGVVIEHREYLNDVYGTTAFKISTYPIDPTNPLTFPWLSKIADNFQQYEFEGLVFCYKPTSGDAISSTNNALGVVISSTQYDVSRPIFRSKTEMESYDFTTSCKPSLSMIHPVECKSRLDIMGTGRYTKSAMRTQILPEGNFSTTSPHTSTEVAENFQNLGDFYLATQGMQADNINVGELWVSYRVKLTKPALNGATILDGSYHTAGTAAFPATANQGPLINSGSFKLYSNSTGSLNSVAVYNAGSGTSERTRLDFTGLPNNTTFTVNVKARTSSVNVGASSPSLASGLSIAGQYFTGFPSPTDIFYAGGTSSGGYFNIHFEGCYRISRTNMSADVFLDFANYVDAGGASTGYVEIWIRTCAPIDVAPYISSTMSLDVSSLEDENKKLSNRLDTLAQQLKLLLPSKREKSPLRTVDEKTTSSDRDADLSEFVTVRRFPL